MYAQGKVQKGSRADSDDDAAAELLKLVEKGHLRAFEPLAELEAHLGEAPVISALIVVATKMRDRIKKRFIVNLKKSGISRSSHKSEKVILPRAMDLVWAALELMEESEA